MSSFAAAVPVDLLLIFPCSAAVTTISGAVVVAAVGGGRRISSENKAGCTIDLVCVWT